MRKSTIAIGIAAALSTQAFVTTTNADAAVKSKIKSSSGPVLNSRPHFVFPRSSRPNGGGVLFDQSGTAVNGAPSQNFEPSYDQYDAQGADDFVVTDAAGWTITGINAQVSPSLGGDPSSATFDIEIYPDAAGQPGATAVCSDPAATGVIDAGITSVSVTLTTPCVLNQGTYWVSFVTNLDFGVGGQLFWSDNSSGTGATSRWQNPGDGFATGCTTWSELASCQGGSTQPVGGGQTAFLFQVLGTVGGGGGGTCGAGELCLVSTVGTDLTPDACATTDTIDASVGDQLNFCYTITNNTSVELDYHTLTNNVDGVLFNLLNQPVAPGASFQYNHIETVSDTATYNSTWTAQDVPPGYSSEVTGGGTPITDRIFCDGFDGTACSTGGGGGGFIDITATGTPLGLGDDSTIGVTIPFSFNFYGTTSNDLLVGNNGGALFGVSSGSLGFSNTSLPAASLSAPAILPLWDDFDSESGDVYTDTRGTTPNRQFIVEWFNRVHFNGTSNTDGATFELILNEDGTLQFEYLDVSYTANGAFGGTDPTDCTNGVCATIGLQQNTTTANQFSFDEASITDNSGIKWTPTAPQSFTGTDSVTVNVGAPSIVVNNGDPIVATVPADGTSTTNVPIENTGDRDLNWTLNEAGPAHLNFPPPGTRFSMPMGDPAKATTARAPIALRNHGKPQSKRTGRSSIHIPFGGATAFGADLYNGNVETFDILDPSTVNVLSPITTGADYVGSVFIDGDFSHTYSVDGFGATPGTIYSIDTTTGAQTVVSDASGGLGAGETYSGMTFDPSSGTTYLAGGACGSVSHLWTVDVNTGATTLVGDITDATCIVAIASDAQGDMYGFDIVSDSLYAIDPSTGAASLIGGVGFNMNYAQDATFDQSTGILYLAGFDADTFTDQLYTVSLTTGEASVIGPIGPSLEEVDGLAIETGGGPCSQPEDLPWVSFSPTSGTTAPGDTTNVTMTADGTGQTDGTELDGTLCVHSNDSHNRTVATPITVTVGSGGGGGGNIVDSGVINAAVNADFTGLYINWLTGDTCTSDTDTGGLSCFDFGLYDFNPWDLGGLQFAYPGDTECVAADAAACDILASGAVIGPASTFAGGNPSQYIATSSTGYLGFSFTNANTAAVNYGYAKFTSTSGTGFPATIVEYWYDNSGAAITIP